MTAEEEDQTQYQKLRNMGLDEPLLDGELRKYARSYGDEWTGLKRSFKIPLIKATMHEDLMHVPQRDSSEAFQLLGASLEAYDHSPSVYINRLERFYSPQHIQRGGIQRVMRRYIRTRSTFKLKLPKGALRFNRVYLEDFVKDGEPGIRAVIDIPTNDDSRDEEENEYAEDEADADYEWVPIKGTAVKAATTSASAAAVATIASDHTELSTTPGMLTMSSDRKVLVAAGINSAKVQPTPAWTVKAGDNINTRMGPIKAAGQVKVQATGTCTVKAGDNINPGRGRIKAAGQVQAPVAVSVAQTTKVQAPVGVPSVQTIKIVLKAQSGVVPPHQAAEMGRLQSALPAPNKVRYEKAILSPPQLAANALTKKSGPVGPLVPGVSVGGVASSSTKAVAGSLTQTPQAPQTRPSNGPHRLIQAMCKAAAGHVIQRERGEAALEKVALQLHTHVVEEARPVVSSGDLPTVTRTGCTVKGVFRATFTTKRDSMAPKTFTRELRLYSAEEARSGPLSLLIATSMKSQLGLYWEHGVRMYLRVYCQEAVSALDGRPMLRVIVDKAPAPCPTPAGQQNETAVKPSPFPVFSPTHTPEVQLIEEPMPTASAAAFTTTPTPEVQLTEESMPLAPTAVFTTTPTPEVQLIEESMPTASAAVFTTTPTPEVQLIEESMPLAPTAVVTTTPTPEVQLIEESMPPASAAIFTTTPTPEAQLIEESMPPASAAIFTTTPTPELQPIEESVPPYPMPLPAPTPETQPAMLCVDMITSTSLIAADTSLDMGAVPDAHPPFNSTPLAVVSVPASGGMPCALEPTHDTPLDTGSLSTPSAADSTTMASAAPAAPAATLSSSTPKMPAQDDLVVTGPSPAPSGSVADCLPELAQKVDKLRYQARHLVRAVQGIAHAMAALSGVPVTPIVDASLLQAPTQDWRALEPAAALELLEGQLQMLQDQVTLLKQAVYEGDNRLSEARAVVASAQLAAQAKASSSVRPGRLGRTVSCSGDASAHQVNGASRTQNLMVRRLSWSGAPMPSPQQLPGACLAVLTAPSSMALATQSMYAPMSDDPSPTGSLSDVRSSNISLDDVQAPSLKSHHLAGATDVSEKQRHVLKKGACEVGRRVKAFCRAFKGASRAAGQGVASTAVTIQRGVMRAPAALGGFLKGGLTCFAPKTK